MSKMVIKSSLIEICKDEIQRQMEIQKVAMDDAQAEANAHKGAMESRYDSFKEEAQRKKDAHAKQYAYLMHLDSAIKNINLIVYDEVKFGSVIETDKGNYFIFAYIFDSPLEVQDKQYLSISLLSPLGKLMQGKKKGDIIKFNTKEILISEIF